jgi:hypothetical protein
MRDVITFTGGDLIRLAEYISEHLSRWLSNMAKLESPNILNGEMLFDRRVRDALRSCKKLKSLSIGGFEAKQEEINEYFQGIPSAASNEVGLESLKLRDGHIVSSGILQSIDAFHPHFLRGLELGRVLPELLSLLSSASSISNLRSCNLRVAHPYSPTPENERNIPNFFDKINPWKFSLLESRTLVTSSRYSSTISTRSLSS